MSNHSSDVEHNKKAKFSTQTVDLRQDFETIKEKFYETRDALTQTAKDVTGKAEEIFGESLKNVKDKSADIQENVITYVKENPVKAVTFALLAGMLVSQLLRK
jgi:ElaB/YqjD/DUF883 family membrane-anchored ribosome-binding protein